jgi:hypothetical protein
MHYSEFIDDFGNCPDATDLRYAFAVCQDITFLLGGLRRGGQNWLKNQLLDEIFISEDFQRALKRIRGAVYENAIRATKGIQEVAAEILTLIFELIRSLPLPQLTQPVDQNGVLVTLSPRFTPTPIIARAS